MLREKEQVSKLNRQILGGREGEKKFTETVGEMVARVCREGGADSIDCRDNVVLLVVARNEQRQVDLALQPRRPYAVDSVEFGCRGRHHHVREKLLVVAHAGAPPIDYGWPSREGTLVPPRNCPVSICGSPSAGDVNPIFDYPHPGVTLPGHTAPFSGLAVIGGYVYRGKKTPALRGVYVYGDYVAGTIWGLRYENGKLTADDILVPSNPQRHISSFAEDSDGELYVISFDGTIYDLIEAGK